MPIDYANYPPTWKEFSYWIRTVRAKNQCECTGECGLHQPNPTPRRCREVHGRPAIWAKGTIRLTVAHLCNCQPICANPAHVIAACQRCHLRIDAKQHAANRAKKSSDRRPKTHSMRQTETTRQQQPINTSENGHPARPTPPTTRTRPAEPAPKNHPRQNHKPANPEAEPNAIPETSPNTCGPNAVADET